MGIDLSSKTSMKVVLCAMIAITSMSSSANNLFYPQILEACIAGTTNYNKGDTELTAKTTVYKSVFDAISALIFFFVGPVLGMHV